jgi:menaquinone-specific isochorismate synthase
MAAVEPLDQRCLLLRVAGNFPACWTFAVNGLTGATPELLLRREDQAVPSLLLAGTAWPGPGAARPAALARQLLASPRQNRTGPRKPPLGCRLARGW